MADKKRFFMGTPQNRVEEPGEKEEVVKIKRKPVPARKIISWSLGTLVLLVLILIALFQLLGFYSQLSGSWDEIVFAYQKPAIVRAVRNDYLTQQQQLENSFLTHQKQTLQGR